MYVFVYTLLIIIFVINTFLSVPFLSYVIGILASVALIMAFRKAFGLYLITGILFLILGGSLFLSFGRPLHTFFLHFESMLGLLALFIVLPFMNSLIHIGHFDSNLNQLLNYRTTRLPQLYMRGSLVSHILGIFLNIATIPLLIKSLQSSFKNFPDDIANRFYTKSILRGYTLCLTWSPLEILISIVVDSTNVKYYQLFTPMFLIAMTFLYLNWMFYSKGTASTLAIKAKNLTNQQLKRIKRKLIQLIMILVVFVVIVSMLETLLGYGYLFSVVISIIPFSIGTAFVLKKQKQYITLTIPNWKNRTANLSNYFFMFLSAGFFVEMVTQTKLIGYIQLFIAQLSDQVILLFLFTGGYFIATAMCGFHPIVSLTLLISILEPLMEQISSISYSLVLISSSIVTAMYSPFNLSASLLSSEIKVNPYQITKWNIGFAVLYMGAVMAVAYLIHLFA